MEREAESISGTGKKAQVCDISLHARLQRLSPERKGKSTVKIDISERHKSKNQIEVTRYRRGINMEWGEKTSKYKQEK